DQRIQSRCRSSAVDAFTSQNRSVSEVGGNAREIERSGCVNNDEIARGTCRLRLVVSQNCADQLCGFLRPLWTKSVEALAFQSKVFRRHCKCFHVSGGRTRGNVRLVRNCYLVQTIGAVDHPGFLDAKTSKSRRDAFEE